MSSQPEPETIRREVSRPAGACLILAAASVLLILLSLPLSLDISPATRSWAVGVTTALIIWLAVYTVCSFRVLRTPYSLANGFVLVFVLYHFGITVPDALGDFADISWGEDPFSQYLRAASWLSLLAMGSYGIGCAIGWRKVQRMDSIVRTPMPLVRAFRKNLRWAGIGLGLAAAVFFAMAVASYGNIFAYERVELFRSTQDSRGWGGFMMVFPSAITLIALGAHSRIQNLAALFLAFLAVCFFLFIGYRSAALFPLLVGIILWRRMGKPLPTSVAITAFVVVVLAIPAAGYWRAQGSYDELDTQVVGQALEATSAADTLKQGQTLALLGQIMRFVPDEDPYRYGTTYLRAAWNAIPNILPSTRESRRAAVKGRVLNEEALWRLNPGSWITYKLAPNKFHRGEGLGFSAVGEPYFNFGVAGVLVYFILLGFLFSKLDSINFYLHPKISLVCFAVLWPLFRTVRNDFANFLKPLGFILTIIAIWYLLCKIIPLFQPGKPGRVLARLRLDTPSTIAEKTD